MFVVFMPCLSSIYRLQYSMFLFVCMLFPLPGKPGKQLLDTRLKPRYPKLLEQQSDFRPKAPPRLHFGSLFPSLSGLRFLASWPLRHEKGPTRTGSTRTALYFSRVVLHVWASRRDPASLSFLANEDSRSLVLFATGASHFANKTTNLDCKLWGRNRETCGRIMSDLNPIRISLSNISVDYQTWWRDHIRLSHIGKCPAKSFYNQYDSPDFDCIRTSQDAEVEIPHQSDASDLWELAGLHRWFYG